MRRFSTGEDQFLAGGALGIFGARCVRLQVRSLVLGPGVHGVASALAIIISVLAPAGRAEVPHGALEQRREVWNAGDDVLEKLATSPSLSNSGI